MRMKTKRPWKEHLLQLVGQFTQFSTSYLKNPNRLNNLPLRTNGQFTDLLDSVKFNWGI
jgi:hypothetical protein